MVTALERAKSLAFWTDPVTPVQIKGGITNANFRVETAGRPYFVRIGDDIPVHGVMRFNELAASRAAALCGLSPEVRHAEPGALVFDFIEARTLAAADVRKRNNLERILALIQRCHRDMPQQVRGPALVFWVFHVLRDYARSLTDANSGHPLALVRLMQMAQRPERKDALVRVGFAP